MRSKKVMLVSYILLLVYVLLPPMAQESIYGTIVLFISGFSFGRSLLLWNKKDKTVTKQKMEDLDLEL